MAARELKIGRVSYSIEVLRSVTEDEAIKMHKNTPQLKPEDIKKAWKAANGLSIPNHLKDQLKGITRNKDAKKSKKD